MAVNTASGEEIEMGLALGVVEGEGAVGLFSVASGVEMDRGAAAELKLGGDLDEDVVAGGATGLDVHDSVAGQGPNEIDVVNHEVEDDVDLEVARRPWAEALGVDVARGCGEEVMGGPYGGVEALGVANAETGLVGPGDLDEGGGLLHGGGEGFFDEDSDAALEEGKRHRGVIMWGNADQSRGDGGGQRSIGGEGDHIVEGVEPVAIGVANKNAVDQTAFPEGAKALEVNATDVTEANDRDMAWQSSSPRGLRHRLSLCHGLIHLASGTFRGSPDKEKSDVYP